MKLCKDCKNQGSKSICQYYGGASNYAERCKFFEEIKQTNADRIRAISDEELAERIAELGCNCCPVNEDVSICCTAIDNCKKAVLMWLQSEAE